MNADELLQLAKRIEAASGDEARFPGDLIRKAWEAFNGGHDYLEGLTDMEARARWFTARYRLNALINAGAYLDAAVALVPEGCLWGVTMREDYVTAHVGSKWKSTPLVSSSATPALALTAACLRAKARSQS